MKDGFMILSDWEKTHENNHKKRARNRRSVLKKKREGSERLNSFERVEYRHDWRLCFGSRRKRKTRGERRVVQEKILEMVTYCWRRQRNCRDRRPWSRKLCPLHPLTFAERFPPPVRTFSRWRTNLLESFDLLSRISVQLIWIVFVFFKN